MDLNDNDGKDNDFDTIKENEYDKDFEKFKNRSGNEVSSLFKINIFNSQNLKKNAKQNFIR
jgi:hypothetical protein